MVYLFFAQFLTHSQFPSLLLLKMLRPAILKLSRIFFCPFAAAFEMQTDFLDWGGGLSNVPGQKENSVFPKIFFTSCPKLTGGNLSYIPVYCAGSLNAAPSGH